MKVGCIFVKLRIADIIEFIDDCTKIDVVGKNGVILYKIRQGERYGSKYCDILLKEIRYITPVDCKTIEIGIREEK